MGILGFSRLSSVTLQAKLTNETNGENEVNIGETEENIIHQLDRLLQYVHIGGQQMTAEQFANIDINVPSFDEWNGSIDSTDDPSMVNILANKDDEENDLPNESPPNLLEVMDMLRRLHLLSSIDYPQLHSIVSELESKLIDIYISRGKRQNKAAFMIILVKNKILSVFYHEKNF